MTVLSILGRIEPICISEKLKLYIANVPNDRDNDWQSVLVTEMQKGLTLHEMNASSLGVKSNERLKIAMLAGHHGPIETETELLSCLRKIASDAIYMYFDYDYDDIPLGGWDTNPFDSRFCEKDYSEKILDFICFSARTGEINLPDSIQCIPRCIYTSNTDLFDDYRFIFGFTRSIGKPIESLKCFGQMLDKCLQSRNDYFLLDYICNAIHQIEEEECSTFQYMKLYSLCQLFLEKEHESELDWKLPMFLDLDHTNEEKKKKAILLRKIRNKIAHGDYVKYDSILEEYAQTIMEPYYNYDYSEYSRHNWVLLSICVSLQKALQRIIALWLQDKDKLEQIKNRRQSP